MFKFIEIKQVSIFVASLVMTVGLLSTPIVLSHNGNVTVPGNVCQPANLAQAVARGMSWNQFRVYNPSDTQGFFVTCGITRSAGDVQASTNAAIIVHYDVGHNISDSVSCIWRVMQENVTSLNIATSVIALAGNITRTSPTLPSTKFNQADFLVGQNEIAFGGYWSATCLLPPKTGINDFHVFGYEST